MNRLNKCIQFQINNIVKKTVIFMIIYSIIYAILALLLFSLGRTLQNSGENMNASGNMNAGFYFAGAIFAVIMITANYRSTFNFLLMFGNTRRNIFLSSSAANILMSVILSALSVLFNRLDILLSEKALNFNMDSSNNLLNILIYKDQVNIGTEFLWYAAIFIMITSFSMLFASLKYKFGKTFIIAFWVGLVLLLNIVPLLVGVNFGDILVKALSVYFCIGVPNGILLAPVNFIITAVIFSFATYAATVRQPQSA